MSGEIVEIGAAVLTVREGDRVAIEPVLRCGGCSACVVGDYQLCGRFRILGTTDDGGFAEFVRTPAYTAFPLPAALDFELGALAEPLAVGVHGVRLGGIGTGQRVVILGAGTIGLLAILAARASGAAHVAVTARHPHQAAAARALGADVVFPADDDGTAGLLAAAAARPVDAVIETVGGGASTLTDALRVVRKGGWIVVLGVFTTPPVLEPILLTLKEPRIVGSLTYGRSGPRADFEVALEILARDPERARTLITHRFPLDAIDTAFATAADKRQRTIKVTIT
jgi:(R,R)-butanediol dehydrogenase/meso-butanediol dehydrogenase/diacetyl reductase/L-iditol 2-dehydrogenase